MFFRQVSRSIWLEGESWLVSINKLHYGYRQEEMAVSDFSEFYFTDELWVLCDWRDFVDLNPPRAWRSALQTFSRGLFCLMVSWWYDWTAFPRMIHASSLNTWVHWRLSRERLHAVFLSVGYVEELQIMRRMIDRKEVSPHIGLMEEWFGIDFRGRDRGCSFLVSARRVSRFVGQRLLDSSGDLIVNLW